MSKHLSLLVQQLLQTLPNVLFRLKEAELVRTMRKAIFDGGEFNNLIRVCTKLPIC